MTSPTEGTTVPVSAGRTFTIQVTLPATHHLDASKYSAEEEARLAALALGAPGYAEALLSVRLSDAMFVAGTGDAYSAGAELLTLVRILATAAPAPATTTEGTPA